MIKMVQVSEIMQKVTTTADHYWLGEGPDEWFRMFRCKLSDSQTPTIIEAIETHGFLDPICITNGYDGAWELGNGHHRLCIAIMLGLDEIPVDFSDWYTSASTAHQREISSTTHDYALARWIASFWDNATVGTPEMV